MSEPDGGLLDSIPTGLGFFVLLILVIGIGLAVHAIARRRCGEERLDRWTRVIEGTIFCAILAAMLLLSGLQVILRNLFHTGVVWVDPFVRTLVLWIALIGAIAATGRARHIRIDVLGRLLPARQGRILTRILATVSAGVCAMLAEGAFVYIREEVHYGVSPFLGIPSWAAQSILLVGFAMLSYRFLVQAIWPSVEAERR